MSNQTGMMARGIDWALLSRGMHREIVNEDGEHIGHSTDETPVDDRGELRPGGERQVGLNRTRVFAGRREYRLRREDGCWRIRVKKLVLLDADQPLYNLTFIL